MYVYKPLASWPGLSTQRGGQLTTLRNPRKLEVEDKMIQKKNIGYGKEYTALWYQGEYTALWYQGEYTAPTTYVWLWAVVTKILS